MNTFGKWAQYCDFTLKTHDDLYKILDMVNENYQDKLKKVLFPEKELTREASL